MPVQDWRPSSIRLTWFKSSYSGANTTECVEAAFVAQAILLRDSKNPDGPCLRVSGQAWADFLTTPPHIHAGG
ncbi:DUF397 domain-containing protein [Streptomyces sp. NPDC102467]|uniref:DUF397 domain-containing protein n=1 Tax=Streptomyces sp. NPDC102467 TaxID=3366179 RepID=UPI0037F8B607